MENDNYYTHISFLLCQIFMVELSPMLVGLYQKLYSFICNIVEVL